MEKFDLIVIGSGPGGYIAAIHAAQKGLSVACIEKEQTLGGTCLNVGCIPSKALLHTTESFYKLLMEGKENGIEANDLHLNFSQMMRRKEQIVTKLAAGIDFLFKKNKVTKVQGQAHFISPTCVGVGDRKLEAPYIILATGSKPIALPSLPFDEKQILSSTGALSLEKAPKKMLLIGAGVIGLEMGSIYQRIGVEVEVIELLDRVVPPLDEEISHALLKIFQKQNMKFHLQCKVLGRQEGESLI